MKTFVSFNKAFVQFNKAFVQFNVVKIIRFKMLKGFYKKSKKKKT